jgi:ornithine cyclodeaminase/alanine dehydrogenase-like protein (mu-crystallin family)
MEDGLTLAWAQSMGTEPDTGLHLIGSDIVKRLLPVADCIDAMESAFRAIALGRAVQPLRTVIRVPGGRDSLYVMPAHVSDDRADALAVKLVSLFPGNAERGLDTHQGAVVLIDNTTGQVRAIIEAGSLTGIRTAAVSALATRHLASPTACELAILGAGVQARTHMEAMLAVRPVRRVRVWSRTADHAHAFARDMAGHHDIPIEVVSDAASAVHGAHIVCTVTAARQPVLSGQWLLPGAHVNAVGASTPDARELDTEAIVNGALWVDSRAAAEAESGDYLIARAEAGPAAVIRGELSDLVTARLPGRTRADEITIFKSLGLAVEDAAAARLIRERAVATGLPATDFR